MFSVKKLLSRSEGAVAIEFAFVVIPFIISILFILELCRVVYIMSSIDLILSEASSATATRRSIVDNNDYFEKMVNNMSNGWALLLVGKNVKVNTNIEYCATMNDLTSRHCSTVGLNTSPLAIYEVNIPYSPIFFVFPSSLVQKQMTRRIVLVQEHNLAR